jgi:hypothetical protein
VLTHLAAAINPIHISRNMCLCFSFHTTPVRQVGSTRALPACGRQNYRSSHAAEPSLASLQFNSYSTYFHFMEPKKSLQHSKKTPTTPYPDLDQSSPYFPKNISLRCILILSTYLRYGLLSGPFIYSFLTNNT